MTPDRARVAAMLRATAAEVPGTPTAAALSTLALQVERGEAVHAGMRLARLRWGADTATEADAIGRALAALTRP